MSEYKCKRCGTTLKSKSSVKLAKAAKALREMGLSSSGTLYWCPKCQPNRKIKSDSNDRTN
jgi:DNA-directed RNA polymerase subunit RPC12/RpoP